MQREIRNKVHIRATVSSFDSTGGSSAIDRTASDYEDAREKVKKRELISTWTYNADIAKYMSRTQDLIYQGMTEDIETKEKAKHISYKGMEQLDFQIMLTDNYCVNPNSIHFCFPMKIKKSRNEASNTDTNLITVNNIFSHQIKEISATRFGHHKQLIRTFSPYGIYQYSKAMLKHLPKDSLKKQKKLSFTASSPSVLTKQ